jgi:uncharacterized phage protein (TIGR01671 family)
VRKEGGMMREIKFRAWDTVRNEYLSSGEIFLAIQPGRRPKNTVTYLDIIKDPDMFKERFIIEQYISLKDKNGKEGYEEDWILAYRRDDNEKKYPQKLRISYLNGCFMVGTCTTHEFYRLYQQDFEIIGNIHENPELMKVAS